MGRTVTYSHIIVDMRPQKDDTIRVRLDVGGNIIGYRGKVTTKNSDLTTLQIHTNSVISTQGCSSPRWEKLPSGYHNYPLKGLNLDYMYFSQKQFSE